MNKLIKAFRVWVWEKRQGLKPSVEIFFIRPIKFGIDHNNDALIIYWNREWGFHIFLPSATEKNFENRYDPNFVPIPNDDMPF